MIVMDGKIEIKAQMGSTGLHRECLLIFWASHVPDFKLMMWNMDGVWTAQWKEYLLNCLVLKTNAMSFNAMVSIPNPWTPAGKLSHTAIILGPVMRATLEYILLIWNHNKMVPIALYYHPYLLIFICFIYFSIYFCYVYELNCCFIAFSDRNTHGTSSSIEILCANMAHLCLVNSNIFLDTLFCHIWKGFSVF